MMQERVEEPGLLLQETRDLIAKLLARSEELMRETQHLSMKLGELTDDHLDEVFHAGL